MSKITQTNIPPKEQCVYSKETQTIGLEPVHVDGKCPLLPINVSNTWFILLSTLVPHNIMRGGLLTCLLDHLAIHYVYT